MKAQQKNRYWAFLNIFPVRRDASILPRHISSMVIRQIGYFYFWIDHWRKQYTIIKKLWKWIELVHQISLSMKSNCKHLLWITFIPSQSFLINIPCQDRHFFYKLMALEFDLDLILTDAQYHEPYQQIHYFGYSIINLWKSETKNK